MESSAQIFIISDATAEINLQPGLVRNGLKHPVISDLSFPGTVKINQDELEKIYAFDAAFFEIGDQISTGLDNVAAGIGGEGRATKWRGPLQTRRGPLV